MQNYKKSVESSSISIIVPIAVAIVIALIEKVSEKKRSAGTAARPRRPVASHEESSHRSEAARHAALARRRSAATAAEEAMAAMKPKPESAPFVPVLPEEGARVTADRPAEAPSRVRPSLPPVPGGDLRKAIIWSEILKRKF